MIASSQDFNRQIRYSHRIATEAWVVCDGAYELQLDITDGNVRIDTGNKYRRTCDVTLQDPTGTINPGSPTDILHPSRGCDLEIRKGIYVNGTPELLLQGIFPIQDATVSDAGGDCTIVMKCQDRGLRIADAKFTRPYVIAAGTNVGTAIHDLLVDRWAKVEFASDFTLATQHTTPAVSFDRSADPWDAAIKLAGDAGFDLYFDNAGRAALRKSDELVSDIDPVFEFHEGEEATILYVRKDLTRLDTYNHIVVVGEPANLPAVSAEAQDDDPTSPWYVDGPFGDRIFLYASPLIRTTAQAQSVANRLLAKHLGYSEHVHFNAIPHPGLDALDVVSIRRERLHLDDRYQLDNITIPLGALRAMECDTRQRWISG